MDTVALILLCAFCVFLAAFVALFLLRRRAQRNILDGPDMVNAPPLTAEDEKTDE